MSAVLPDHAPRSTEDSAQPAGGCRPAPHSRTGRGRSPRDATFGPVPLGLRTCALRLPEVRELSGPGSGGRRTPWRDEPGLRLPGGTARGVVRPTCGKKEAWDGGGEVATGVPRGSDFGGRWRPGRARTGCSPPVAAERPGPPGPRSSRQSAARQGVPRPEAPRAHRLTPLPRPPSASLPGPHLPAVLHAWQPCVGLGVVLLLPLLAHLRVLAQRHSRRHPGELLPPHGAALLRVSGTLPRGPWPLNAAPRHSGLWARCRPASQSPGGCHSPPWQPSYACLGSRLPGAQRRPDDAGPPAASRSVRGTEGCRQGAEARPCLPPTTTEFPWEDRAGYGKARNAASLRATRWAGQARQAPPWDESPLSDTAGPSSGAPLKQPELCASPLPSAETCVGTAKPQPCRLLASSTPGARVPGKRDTSLLACQTCPSHEGKPGVMEGMPTLVHGAGWEGDSTPTSPHSASSSTAPAWAFISHLVKWTVLSWTCKVP